MITLTTLESPDAIVGSFHVHFQGRGCRINFIAQIALEELLLPVNRLVVLFMKHPAVEHEVAQFALVAQLLPALGQCLSAVVKVARFESHDVVALEMLVKEEITVEKFSTKFAVESLGGVFLHPWQWRLSIP